MVTPDGLLRPAQSAASGALYCGGSAKMIERALGVEGNRVLYVGDHIYTDVSISKIEHKWRTCLIIRELEDVWEAELVPVQEQGGRGFGDTVRRGAV